MMTNYIRFFHVEVYHLRFVTIEAMVTLLVLLVFALLPAKSLAFFPILHFAALRKSRGGRASLYSFSPCWAASPCCPLSHFPRPTFMMSSVIFWRAIPLPMAAWRIRRL